MPRKKFEPLDITPHRTFLEGLADPPLVTWQTVVYAHTALNGEPFEGLGATPDEAMANVRRCMAARILVLEKKNQHGGLSLDEANTLGLLSYQLGKEG